MTPELKVELDVFEQSGEFEVCINDDDIKFLFTAPCGVINDGTKEAAQRARQTPEYALAEKMVAAYSERDKLKAELAEAKRELEMVDKQWKADLDGIVERRAKFDASSHELEKNNIWLQQRAERAEAEAAKAWDSASDRLDLCRKSAAENAELRQQLEEARKALEWIGNHSTDVYVTDCAKNALSSTEAKS